MRINRVVFGVLVLVCTSLASGEDEKATPTPTPSPTPRRVLTLTDKDLPKTKPKVTEPQEVTNDTEAPTQAPTQNAAAVPEKPKTLDAQIEEHNRTIKELRQTIIDNEAEAEKLARKGSALLAESEQVEDEAKKKLRRPDYITGNVYYGDRSATLNGNVKTSQGEGIALADKARQLRAEGNQANERSKTLIQDNEAKKRRMKIEQADLSKAIMDKAKAKKSLTPDPQ